MDDQDFPGGSPILVTVDANGAGRLLKLPRLDTDAAPHFGKEQIEGLGRLFGGQPAPGNAAKLG